MAYLLAKGADIHIRSRQNQPQNQHIGQASVSNVLTRAVPSCLQPLVHLHQDSELTPLHMACLMGAEETVSFITHSLPTWRSHLLTRYFSFCLILLILFNFR